MMRTRFRGSDCFLDCFLLLLHKAEVSDGGGGPDPPQVGEELQENRIKGWAKTAAESESEKGWRVAAFSDCRRRDLISKDCDNQSH